MGNRLVLAVIVAAAVAAVGSTATGGWATATDHNPVESPDPTGDSGSAADISNVLTGNTLAGVFRFEITIANRTTFLQDTDVIAVFIDADRNQTVDYEIHSIGNTGLELVKVVPTGTERVAAASLLKIWSSGKLTLRVSSADLGNTTGFVYYVGSGVLSGSSAAVEDFAPDGDRSFVYTLSTPHIDRVVPAYSSASPRAGKRFRVTRALVRFETGEGVTAESFRCIAKVGRKVLRGTGAGGCTFALPASARGKRLSLTITATFRDQSATATSSLRVR
jgi:hypothetical protein